MTKWTICTAFFDILPINRIFLYNIGLFQRNCLCLKYLFHLDNSIRQLWYFLCLFISNNWVEILILFGQCLFACFDRLQFALHFINYCLWFLGTVLTCLSVWCVHWYFVKHYLLSLEIKIILFLFTSWNYFSSIRYNSIKGSKLLFPEWDARVELLDSEFNLLKYIYHQLNEIHYNAMKHVLKCF